MDELKVKDRILENISFSVKKLQSYFAACEDETPAIRNHDRVLQRLCEHLDHALLYGLQDISSGYWVLVLHFTRREAVRQIDELQNIATNLGRSRAWLYLALSESSLESYLRLFQENQVLLQKYYFKNALVCSHDHLTLFLTLMAGLEFIRFDLELDVPYLDVAAYMPEYYKPHNLLDFEERLPSSDSLSLHSFTSLTSTNLEWDDSAIAPSSEEGDLTDQASCPRSSGSDPLTVISDSVALSSGNVKAKVGARLSPPRHNPFNQDSDANTSADVTPVHMAAFHIGSTGDDIESTNNELEVIRMARRRKASKKRRGKSSTDSISCNHDSLSSEHIETDSIFNHSEDQDSFNCTVIHLDGARAEVAAEHDDDGDDAFLRLPEMLDTSMDSVGQPLRDVMDRLNGETREQPKSEQRLSSAEGPEPPVQQPFPEDSEAKPPDPDSSPELQQAAQNLLFLTTDGPEAAAPGSGNHDPTEHRQSQILSGGHEDQREAETNAGREQDVKKGEGYDTDKCEITSVRDENLSPSESSHPAEFKVDNNHLLLLMIHVFRENEEQLFRMVRMSTGHMEGDLQPLYLLLTDCYIYLLRKGAAEKPYTVEDAVSYNELDYLSVGLDQQTVSIICTNRRRKFLFDTADASLTLWFLSILKTAMVKGCREPPYPPILTDATMEKLALTKFVSQESHCEVSEVSIHLYSLVHWEDPMDASIPNLKSPSSAKEGLLQYRAGSTYLGKELWKSCYLVLSNGILYLYAERTDVTPLLSVTMGGEYCGGCRRSNGTERPHAFQVILTERPPLELSANNEQDMADWMLLLCQSVSKGVIPQGAAPTTCIPCCLVVTNSKLLTCHQDCQTSFFRSLGSADICDVKAVSLEVDMEYCVIEFAADRDHFLPPWVLYFSGCEERDRLLEVLDSVWRNVFQVALPHRAVCEPSVKKRCSEGLALMKSAWQRADSLARGRAQREPWC
ncbi:pleckstrin homology domain-containing family M member 2 isoform X2 [Corythoichthys intestinalis]|uniref:pleckstrin homology domain-containing family M member 2 isoform X2 n=1 Tax=Corythoichthys intestinalis TaxID=161448 RepID=UPI0025A4FAA7|nr:pleckstrin homology domain-containing family M member 2 isoform X2 [Corythoichthys intestinalis]